MPRILQDHRLRKQDSPPLHSQFTLRQAHLHDLKHARAASPKFRDTHRHLRRHLTIRMLQPDMNQADMTRIQGLLIVGQMATNSLFHLNPSSLPTYSDLRPIKLHLQHIQGPYSASPDMTRETAAIREKIGEEKTMTSQ